MRVLPSRKPARRRSPWLVVLWTILTVGLYHPFWWYFVNRELRDYGLERQDADLGSSDPAMSALAVTLGSLIVVPPFVSYWGGMTRLRAAQRLAGVEESSGGLFAVLIVSGFVFILPFVVAYGYYQAGLNRMLETLPRVDDGPAVAPGADPSSPESVAASIGLG